MGVITRGATLEQELAAAAAEFEDNEDDENSIEPIDVADIEEATVEAPKATGRVPRVQKHSRTKKSTTKAVEPTATESDNPSFEAYEARLLKTVDKRIAARAASLKEKLGAYKTVQVNLLRQKLDEYAVRHGDLAHVSDPVVAKEAVSRQIATHQKALENLQAQLAKL